MHTLVSRRGRIVMTTSCLRTYARVCESHIYRAASFPVVERVRIFLSNRIASSVSESSRVVTVAVSNNIDFKNLPVIVIVYRLSYPVAHLSQLYMRPHKAPFPPKYDSSSLKEGREGGEGRGGGEGNIT